MCHIGDRIHIREGLGQGLGPVEIADAPFDAVAEFGEFGGVAARRDDFVAARMQGRDDAPPGHPRGADDRDLHRINPSKCICFSTTFASS